MNIGELEFSTSAHKLSLNRLVPSIAFAMAILTGCSGSDTSESFSAGVTQLRVENSDIEVGEATVAAVDFTYSSEAVFSDNEQVEVVVRLPPELSFVDGTAEIDRSVGGDKEVGARITRCESGVTYLEFNMDRYDLEGSSNPSGDGDARLTLTVRGESASLATFIEAAARDDYLSFGCALPFLADEEVAVTVFP